MEGHRWIVDSQEKLEFFIDFVKVSSAKAAITCTQSSQQAGLSDRITPCTYGLDRWQRS